MAELILTRNFLWIEEIQQKGAGEIYITSIDKDGTLNGPDLDLIEYVKIPLRFQQFMRRYFAKTILQN